MLCVGIYYSSYMTIKKEMLELCLGLWRRVATERCACRPLAVWRGRGQVKRVSGSLAVKGRQSSSARGDCNGISGTHGDSSGMIIAV